MLQSQWRVLGEITAGNGWAAVADHPPVEQLDRTHCGKRVSIGYQLLSGNLSSRGCFQIENASTGYSQIGAVAVIPAGVPLHVTAQKLPMRRMLHCKLPEHAAAIAGAIPLSSCMDVRSDALTRSLKRLAQEVIGPGFAAEIIVEGLSLVIAGELGRLAAGRPATRQRGGMAPWQLRRIDEHILDGNWNCSVSEIGKLCGVSASHTMRAFRQSTGRSLAAHLSELRIERACYLLERTGMSIAEVSAQLSFAAPSAFSAAFRRATGTTPRAFRQSRTRRD